METLPQKNLPCLDIMLLLVLAVSMVSLLYTGLLTSRVETSEEVVSLPSIRPRHGQAREPERRKRTRERERRRSLLKRTGGCLVVYSPSAGHFTAFRFLWKALERRNRSPLASLKLFVLEEILTYLNV